jgi:hypothetical protein
MKYMIIQQVKEPLEENIAKTYEIEKKRQEKGEAFSLHNKMLTPQYMSLNGHPTLFWVVDCEPEDLVKFSKAYGNVLSIEAIPVVTRNEWEKL